MLASNSGNISNSSLYGNERSATETEYNADPVSGSFFHLDYKKHDDLKEMLDSNKDSLKLEAMKRIIGMVAKGRDASELFPAVVKNVVSKNIEVKKLVYVYLVRYAEEQQDLVLLSISTFQRALKEPNQLIRASALRVLSSIRVTMIVPIVMLAIRDAAADMSPYVRKTAAHAIPKLYSLDPEQKPELISIIERLLADRTTLVVGSAVMAFTEVCPERSDLIHKVYRKLCGLLVDVDEWGQIVIINMLTRYARTHFSDPNIRTHEDDEDEGTRDSDSDFEKITTSRLDPDHRLLLKSVRPLLQSRNAAVVMAVAQLYHHTAPNLECKMAARALVRLLRSHSEVQSIVLDAIASISVHKQEMFEPYLMSFFVRTSDLTRIKLLKLDILTNLATVGNISLILRELRTYLCSSDKQFIAATIQAIGRCACSIRHVTDSCLNGLVSLLSSKDEAIVAESVVVIKRLLQTKATDPLEIVIQMAKLLDSITVAQARAAILWLLGEYAHDDSYKVLYIAPDVLRKLAKTFCQEHDIVKLQVLNLAVKLYLNDESQTTLLCQYIFNLARYDQNYDIRDRARLLKYFCQTSTSSDKSFLKANAAKVFQNVKPAPLLQSRFKDRIHLQLGSLSHYINVRANGYQALPSFPRSPTSSSVRNVDTTSAGGDDYTRSIDKKDVFFWESGSSSPAQTSESESSSASEEESGDDNSSDFGKYEKDRESSKEQEGSDSEEESEEDSSVISDSSEAETKKTNTSNSNAGSYERENDFTKSRVSIHSSAHSKEAKDTSKSSHSKNAKEPNENTTQPPARSNLDLLLDLDADISSAVTPVMTPSLGGFLTPVATESNIAQKFQINTAQSVPPIFLPNKEIKLLERINGRGLSITYRYTRTAHLFSPHMVNIALTFTNNTQQDITDIRMEKKPMPTGMIMHDFACIAVLNPCCSLPGTLGIDFNDSTQPATLEIVSSVGTSTVSIKPPIGELLRPVNMNEDLFTIEQNKLRGMNEHTITISSDKNVNIAQSVQQAANLGLVYSSAPNVYRFVGVTLTSLSLVLAHILTDEDKITITVNCEKIVVGSMLLNDIKTALSSSCDMKVI